MRSQLAGLATGDEAPLGCWRLAQQIMETDAMKSLAASGMAPNNRSRVPGGTFIVKVLRAGQQSTDHPA
jgi:hypothetical protein